MSFNKVNSDGSITRVAGGTLYADAPVGAIMPYGGTTAPSGWFLCRGQAVSRTTYAELFKVIGTAFGAGDGSTTFNIPDLREATVKGVGENPNGASHIKSGGLSLGEFIDDRLQDHTHAIDLTDGGSAYVHGSTFSTNGMVSADVTRGIKNNGRTGATTEVKAVGVNYIIKATQVGVPADLMDAVEEAVEEAAADLAPVDVVEDGNMKAVTSNAVAVGRPEYYNKQLTVTAYEAAQLSVTSAYLRGQKVICKDGKTRIFGKIILGGVGNPNGDMNRHPCKITGFPGLVTLLEGRLPCLVWSGWTGFYSMDNIATGVFAPIVAGGGNATAEEACFTPQDVVVEVTE